MKRRVKLIIKRMKDPFEENEVIANNNISIAIIEEVIVVHF
jgi:hypothetical protein